MPSRYGVSRHGVVTLQAKSLGIVCAIVCGALLSIVQSLAFAHGESASTEPSVVLAPGYESLQFSPPVPGTYQLPDFGAAADGIVVDTNGESHSLHEFLQGKTTALSFLYRACDDVNGCPLATYVMHGIREKLSHDETLVDAVQLISMSFDPLHDTPVAMRTYADSFGKSSVNWHFLTGESEVSIESILSAYGQTIRRVNRDDGKESINHLLRVYVIDKDLRIRNIYNSSLLHADTLLSDILTLELERADIQPTDLAADSPAISDLSNPENQPVLVLDAPKRAADDRSGYADGSYVSQTRSLHKEGLSADLLTHATTATLGLPAQPKLDELSSEVIELGRHLFFDRRLSINDTFSCAMCHVPEQAYTVNDLSTAIGVEGRTGKRNAPTLLNAGYLNRLFHDGREFELEQQIWAPLLARNEMANPSIGYVLNKIREINTYGPMFSKAFGTDVPTMETLGLALASYQRTLVSGNSPFDQWYFGKDADAVSTEVKVGMRLFAGKAQCIACHTIGDTDALFTDQRLHNTGIGYAQTMLRSTKTRLVTVAPGVILEVDPAVYAAAAEKPPSDLGLYEVTQNPVDRWKFKTPSLRNVALTAPYMHDGSVATLEEVIDFYNIGGIQNELLSPIIQPLKLLASERQALVAFLNALTGDGLPLLVSDSQTIPVGDTTGQQSDRNQASVQ